MPIFEGSCYIFSTRNNSCETLAFYGLIFESSSQSYFKTPVCGAPLSSLCKYCEVYTGCGCKLFFISHTFS